MILFALVAFILAISLFLYFRVFILYLFLGPFVGLNATAPKNATQAVIVVTQSDEISKVAGLLLTIEGVLLGLSPLFFQEIRKVKNGPLLGAGSVTVTAFALLSSLLTVVFADTNASANVIEWMYFFEILSFILVVSLYVGLGWYLALHLVSETDTESIEKGMASRQ